MALGLSGGCGRLDFVRMTPDGSIDGALDGGRPDALSEAGSDARLVDAAADAPPPDSGEPPLDASPDAAPPPGLATVDSFEIGWATETNAYWQWAVSIAADDFDRFELVTGPTTDVVRARADSSTLWGSAQNPELGFLEIPSGDPVTHTLTVGHPPGSRVFGQLAVWDTRGGVTFSEVVSIQLLSPTAEIVLFADADTAGYSIPASYARSATDPYAGTYCYEFTCGPSDCFENLRRQNIAVDVSAIPADAFDGAFFEFALRLDGPPEARPSYWSDVRLGFADGSLLGFHWITFSRGPYRVIQIPLAQLTSADGALTPALTSSTLLDEFWVGGQWPADTAVRFDEARIRW